MRETFTLNGVEVAPRIIGTVIEKVTHPDPDVWYNFKRIGDRIEVTTDYRPSKPMEPAGS